MTRIPPRIQSRNGTGKSKVAQSKSVLVVEDDAARSKRRPIAGLRRIAGGSRIVVRMHRILNGQWKKIAGEVQVPKAAKRGGGKEGRSEAALTMLKKNRRRKGSIVVAGTSYGGSAGFIEALTKEEIDFAVEVRPSTSIECIGCAEGQELRRATASDLLANAEWRNAEVTPPGGKSSVRYTVADLAEIHLPGSKTGRLFAAQTGGIKGVHSGTIIGMTSLCDAPLEDLLRCIGWARWIRPLVRRQERRLQKPPTVSNGNGAARSGSGLALRYRSNISLARLQDECPGRWDVDCFGDGPRGVQFDGAKVLNLVELFAGAGGWGLGS